MDAYLVFIILVQVYTTLLSLPPMLGHTIIHIRLMYDFWYQLWPVINQGGIGRGDLGGVYGVGGTIFDEEREESKDGANEEDYY